MSVAWIPGVVGDGIKLVVSHHGMSAAAVDHRADDSQHFSDLRPPVDKIANENGRAGRVGIVAS